MTLRVAVGTSDVGTKLKGGLALSLRLRDVSVGRNTHVRKSQGVFLTRMCSVSSSLADVQPSFFIMNSVCYGLLINNVALVLLLFFRKTCLFCRVVFFKVA